MDLRALESFIVLYETKNMHKAADRLFISQQGLSRTIRSLEAEWEAVFFERDRAGMLPTKAGEYFYQEALKLRRQLSAMRHDLEVITGEKEEIVLACSYGSMFLLYPQLQRFEKLQPKYRVNWAEYTDRETDRLVLTKEADLGLCVHGSELRNVRFQPLLSRKMLLLVYEGHPLWERESIRFRDLREEKIIIEGADFHIYELFRQLCLEEGFYPNIVARTAEINFCQHLCRLRAGLSVTVDFIAERSKLDGMRAIPFADERFRWVLGLGKHMSGELNEGARLLEGFLLEACG